MLPVYSAQGGESVTRICSTLENSLTVGVLGPTSLAESSASRKLRGRADGVAASLSRSFRLHLVVAGA